MPRARATAAQYALLEGNLRNPQPGPAGQPRPRKPLERELGEQIKTFLEWRGWTVFRVQSGLFSRPWDEDARIRVGKKGIPDWRAERALNVPNIPGAMQVFWYETKQQGKRPRREQLLWLERLRLSGAVAAWFDQFEADEFDSGPAERSRAFQRFYFAVFKDRR